MLNVGNGIIPTKRRKSKWSDWHTTSVNYNLVHLLLGEGFRNAFVLHLVRPRTLVCKVGDRRVSISTLSRLFWSSSPTMSSEHWIKHRVTACIELAAGICRLPYFVKCLPDESSTLFAHMKPWRISQTTRRRHTPRCASQPPGVRTLISGRKSKLHKFKVQRLQTRLIQTSKARTMQRPVGQNLPSFGHRKVNVFQLQGVRPWPLTRRFATGPR